METRHALKIAMGMLAAALMVLALEVTALAASEGDTVEVPAGASLYTKKDGKTNKQANPAAFTGKVVKVKDKLMLVESPNGQVWVEIAAAKPAAAPAATPDPAKEPEKKAEAAAPPPATQTPPAKETPKADPEAKKMHVLVLQLKGHGVDEATVQLLNDHVLIVLDKYPQLKVTSQAEMMVVAKYESEKQMLTCENDISCVADLSKSLQADAVLSGSVGQVGESFVINLQLIDANKAIVINRVSETAYEKEKLKQALEAALDGLFNPEGQKLAKKKFTLEIKPGQNKFAVLDLQAAGVKEHVARNLTDIVTVEMKKFKGISVISRQEIQTMLQFEQDKQAVGCTDDVSCFAEIGAALGVQYLVIGSVGSLEGVYVINLKLLYILKSEVVNRVTETYKGPQTNLVMAVRSAVEQLMGAQKEGDGNLKLSVSEEDAKVFVNGKEVGVYPTVKSVKLPAGKHAVRIEQDDAYTWYQETYVESGDTTELDAQLELKPTPWYKTWWFWTITGVAIVGAAGATTAVLLLQDSGGSAKGNVDVTNPLIEQ